MTSVLQESCTAATLRRRIAKNDLTAAYGNAAGRPTGANTAADLANLHLQAGVYAVHSRGRHGPHRSARARRRGQPELRLHLPDELVARSPAPGAPCSSSTAPRSATCSGRSAARPRWAPAPCSAATSWRTSPSPSTANVTVHGRALASVGAVTLDQRRLHGADLCQLTGAVRGFPATPVTTPATTPAGGGGGTTAHSGPGHGNRGTRDGHRHRHDRRRHRDRPDQRRPRSLRPAAHRRRTAAERRLDPVAPGALRRCSSSAPAPLTCSSPAGPRPSRRGHRSDGPGRTREPCWPRPGAGSR